MVVFAAVLVTVILLMALVVKIHMVGSPILILVSVHMVGFLIVVPHPVVTGSVIIVVPLDIQNLGVEKSMVSLIMCISVDLWWWQEDDCRRHSRPTWNIPISFKVEEETAANQILVVDLRCCAPTGSDGDKDIGEVLVQVKDPMGSIEDNSLTYQIRTPFGNPKAKLTFMYKWAYEKVSPLAMAGVTGFTTPYEAAAATWQFNPPYPSPAPVMGPPP
ncbi:hypothetical protein TEA_016598 [Camellia sinensis var. sinensis]|uniref:C2 domain-containing protein n=1 Tax=Camellia sinensis var. sinensis TaxID=542762 RepID=A0A4S4E1I0_CAMSN|nr:hypothetical protein TEA_016598 [Camellia sinensis var. sinensis]